MSMRRSSATSLPSGARRGSGRDGQDVPAIGLQLSGDRGLHDRRVGRRVTQLGFECLPLGEDCTESGRDLVGPVGELLVAVDVEADFFEVRTVVRYRVFPERQVRDSVWVKLEG